MDRGCRHAKTTHIERGSPWENGYIGKPPRGASEASSRGRRAGRCQHLAGRTDPFDLILTNEPEDLRLKLVAANSVVRRLMPVRARLATRPLSTGSAPVKEMMGIVVVAPSQRTRLRRS